MSIASVPTSELRNAAAAWRRADWQASAHYQASGFFKWFTSPPNMSLHDRIDDLVDEVARLRRQSAEGSSGSKTGTSP